MEQEMHDSTAVGVLLVMLGLAAAWFAKSMIDECHEALLDRYPQHGKIIARASWAGLVSVIALVFFGVGIWVVITEPVSF